MPSKPAKDLLSAIPDHLKSSTVCEPARKRAKTSENAPIKSFSLEQLKELKQQKKVVLGLKDVVRAIESNDERLIVFVVHNNEIEVLNKHVVALCRQKNVRHIIIPKFMHQQVTSLFAVKRLSTFALFKDDSALLDSFISGFDNSVQSKSNLDEHKYGKEHLFRSCQVKRWNVLKPVVDKK